MTNHTNVLLNRWIRVTGNLKMYRNDPHYHAGIEQARSILGRVEDAMADEGIVGDTQIAVLTRVINSFANAERTAQLIALAGQPLDPDAVRAIYQEETKP